MRAWAPTLPTALETDSQAVEKAREIRSHFANTASQHGLFSTMIKGDRSWANSARRPRREGKAMNEIMIRGRHMGQVAGAAHERIEAARKTPAEVLARALERHQTWVGSGWEMGARADLHGADLHGAQLTGAILESADLHKADLHRAALGEADLESADLHGADLHRADLHAAQMNWADLHDADLHGANLSGGSLCDADLRGADCHGAVFTDADLAGADLRGANLSRALGLTRSQIAAATTDTKTRLP